MADGVSPDTTPALGVAEKVSFPQDRLARQWGEKFRTTFADKYDKGPEIVEKIRRNGEITILDDETTVHAGAQRIEHVDAQWAPRLTDEGGRKMVFLFGYKSGPKLGLESLKVSIPLATKINGKSDSQAIFSLPYLRFSPEGAIDYNRSFIYLIKGNRLEELRKLISETPSSGDLEQKSNIKDSFSSANLPESFKIEEDYSRLTLALWNALPEKIKELVGEKVDKVTYPVGSVRIGNGHVRPSAAKDGLVDVEIGHCLDPKYYAELFYHEIGHVVIDCSNISEETKEELKKASKSLYEDYEKRGRPFDTSHMVIDSLSMYVLYSEAFEKLASSHEGWDIALKAYRKLLGETPDDVRGKIFNEIERARDRMPSYDPDSNLRTFSERQKKGYLLNFSFFQEVGDLLQLPGSKGIAKSRIGRLKKFLLRGSR